MGLLQEARIAVLNVLSKPLRTTFVSKDKIESMEGGEHIFPEKEDYMVLFSDPGSFPSREVTVVDKRGRKTGLHEIVAQDKVGEKVIIQQG